MAHSSDGKSQGDAAGAPLYAVHREAWQSTPIEYLRETKECLFTRATDRRDTVHEHRRQKSDFLAWSVSRAVADQIHAAVKACADRCRDADDVATKERRRAYKARDEQVAAILAQALAPDAPKGP